MIAHALQAQALAGLYDDPCTRCLFLVREASPAYGSPAQPEPEPDRPDASSRPPDPFEDADALELLGDEIATLAAYIHAATHRLLVLVVDFDRRGGWELGGHRSCAHWLAFRTGIDLGAAREKVRTARVLVGLPETSASMARGELSFSQVRALSRIARPDNEHELLDLARGCTTAQLERMVRGWKRTNSRKDEVALERERQNSRTFSVFPDLDGMYVVRGKLPPEVGLLLMRAIEAASDQVYREQPVEALETERAAAQRRADALALLAERAMAAGLSADAEAPSAEPAPSATRSCCTWTRRPCRPQVSRATPSSTTARAFPLKRLAASPATPGSCACGMDRTVRSSMSAAGPEPSRPRSAALSRPATVAAAFRAAASASPTDITSAPGPTGARRA